MIFVTNDLNYQYSPRNVNVGYAQFSIHSNRNVAENEILNWNGNLSISKNRPAINLSKSYQISWHPLPIDQHFYILV